MTLDEIYIDCEISNGVKLPQMAMKKRVKLSLGTWESVGKWASCFLSPASQCYVSIESIIEETSPVPNCPWF